MQAGGPLLNRGHISILPSLPSWCPTSARFWQMWDPPLTAHRCPFGLDLDGTDLGGCVMAKATPAPAHGLGTQAATDRVTVNVAELIGETVGGADVVVEITLLPEPR